MIFVKNRPM